MADSQMAFKTEKAFAKIGASCHHISGAEDKVMSAVLGGCSFVSSSRFTEHLATVAMKSPEEQVPWYQLKHPLSFYRYVTGRHERAWTFLVSEGRIHVDPDIADSDYSDAEFE